MIATFFGGISSGGAHGLLCQRMARAASRWPFVEVRSGTSGRAWFGETLPGHSSPRWHACGPGAMAYGSLKTQSFDASVGEPRYLEANPRETSSHREDAFEPACLDAEVTLRPDAGEIELWSGDGWNPLFYTLDEGNLLFGTDPTVVCSALTSPPQLDPVGIASILTLEHPPPERTLFQGIRRLPPYHRVAGEVTAGSEGWRPAVSCTKAVVAQLSEGETSVEEAAECFIRAAAEAIAETKGAWLPLSGGRDSRAILAAIQPQAGLRAYTRGSPRDAEVAIAARVAKIARTRHQSFAFPRDYLQRSFPRIVHLTGGSVSAMHGHAIHPLERLVESGAQVVLPGTNGEFGRAFWPSQGFTGVRDEADFWRRFFALNLRLPEGRLRRFFRPPWDEAVGAAVRQVQTEYAADLPILGNAPQIDLDHVYLLRRTPLFAAWGPYIWGSALSVRMPYRDARYLKAVSGLPASHRLEASVQRCVIRSRSPKLLKVPLIPSWHKLEPGPGEAWRARWRPLFASLRGISRGSPQKYRRWLWEERAFVESILFSDAAAGRRLFNIAEIRKLWEDHLGGGDRTALLCNLLTLELACRINLDRTGVDWGD